MLVRAVKPYFDGLHFTAKQLVVWTLNKKQDFHSSCRLENFTKDKNATGKHERWMDNDFLEEDYDGDSKWKRRSNNFSNYREDYNQYNRRRWSNNFSNRRENSHSRYDKWWNDRVSEKEVNLNDLKEFKKNFYNPHPDVLNRSEEEVQEFHKKNEIQIFGKNKKDCPRPILSFNELGLPSTVMDIIRKLNYTEPTPIQSQTWPVALSGLNMVGVAQTGSGKTLGFVLPGMIHVQNQIPLSGDDGPIALVISPTRELTKQINSVVLPFARSYSFRNACVFGGSPKHHQRMELESAEICIGTPGRLIDFLEESHLNLRRCTYCVLDEADLLMDMGFEPQIRQIMSHMRKDSQILMWSATWPKEVQHLAADFLKDFIGVKFGSSELTANSNITQRVYICNRNEKVTLLLQILDEIKKSEDKKTLIFCQTKDSVDSMFMLLRKKGYRVMYIHGGKSQSHRDNTMKKFRSGSVQILVGTSVVGRGLDIDDIKHVIIYDFPNEIEGYVHLIGRTGRASNTGTSYTLFTQNDSPHAADLIKILKESNQEVDPQLEELARLRYGGKGRMYSRYNRY